MFKRFIGRNFMIDDANIRHNMISIASRTSVDWGRGMDFGVACGTLRKSSSTVMCVLFQCFPASSAPVERI